MDCVFVVDRHILSEVEVSGEEILESLVWTFLVIEEEVVSQSLDQERDGVIGFEVEVLVFDGSPESFDEHVVEGSAAPIHADADAFSLEPGGELGAL